MQLFLFFSFWFTFERGRNQIGDAFIHLFISSIQVVFLINTDIHSLSYCIQKVKEKACYHIIILLFSHLHFVKVDANDFSGLDTTAKNAF